MSVFRDKNASVHHARARFCFYGLRAALLIAPAVLMASSGPAHAAPPAAQSAPKTATPTPKSNKPAHKTPTLQDYSAALLHASSPTESAMILSDMDGLRRAHTDPTTALLQHRATRDLDAQKNDEAVSDLSDAMTLQPDQTILRRDRAAAQIAAGHYDAAITDLGIYLQAEPADPQAWATLAQAEMGRKDYKAALSAWERMLALAPQISGGQEHLKELRLKAFGRAT